MNIMSGRYAVIIHHLLRILNIILLSLPGEDFVETAYYACYYEIIEVRYADQREYLWQRGERKI
ncbi:hypothetical protein BRYFOR_07943 [Marvinbryantia formatexigens DSM 14469]|uniref:Uncharacterized protein n=1 Tax=Marvinbryantia formatexigens DSM 14469 TaxID=478749 RepID=C6LH33_9FIRM|nr:hypothetical protein BRYFOR_07943 [Marvinbryantia formatexigens DSM 14469]